MQVREIVVTTIDSVAAENRITLVQLTDELPLLESGLDSLCLAVIVARLEDQLGVDPFSTNDDMAFPVTVGDLIKLYQYALA